MAEGRDPLRYFRIEARELVDQISAGVLDLDPGRSRPPDLVARLLRFAHTLKGAARVVRQTGDRRPGARVRGGARPAPRRRRRRSRPTRCASCCGSTTDRSPAGLVAPTLEQRRPARTRRRTRRRRPGRLSSGRRRRGRAATSRPSPPRRPGLDRAAGRHGRPRRAARRDRRGQRPDRAAARAAGHPGAGLPAGRDARRAAAHRRCAAATRAGVDRRTTGSVHAADYRRARRARPALHRTVDQVERELDEVRGRAEGLRLVAAGTIFTALHRAVRDAADAEGKRVRFDGRGGDIRLDPHLLTQVSNAFLHVGAQRGGARHRAGGASGPRPASRRRARVIVEVDRRGRCAAFRCRDDGRGFDLAAVCAGPRGARRPGDRPTADRATTLTS